MNKRKFQRQNKDPKSPRNVQEYLEMYEDLEPLSDQLVEELRTEGVQITDDDLSFFRSQNMKYSRKRESFLTPPEGFGNMVELSNEIRRNW